MTKEQETSTYCHENYHRLVGISGKIKAYWPPEIRTEMHRLKTLQMAAVRRIAKELREAEYVASITRQAIARGDVRCAA